jgi:hypothetical protein
MKKRINLLSLMLMLLTFGVQAQQATLQTTNQLLVDSQNSSFFNNNCAPQSSLKVFNLAINDSSGLGVCLSAMIVIFIVLIVLFLFFKLFAIISIRSAENRKAKLTGVKIKISKSEHIPGEVYAAISMALYELNDDAHDIEHAVLTIERTRRPYSPWSSKIYGMRQLPEK